MHLGSTDAVFPEKTDLRCLRLGVVCDLLQENWPSMDLVARMLLNSLQENHCANIRADALCPEISGLFFPREGIFARAATAERAFHRIVRYSHWLSKQRNSFDLFHVIDHSYAHLAHQLPPERTVITCHDTDAFSCLLEDVCTMRGFIWRKITRHILSGLQKAAWVVCDSRATANELSANGWVPPERTSVAHLGVSQAFSLVPDCAADQEAKQLLAACGARVVLLHVGSTIQRKRIDVLLRTVAQIKREFPGAILVRVGGAFTAEQRELSEQLKIADSILTLPFLSERVLAAMYRRSSLVLLPSEREGFGLPVLEALSCGIPVIASDIPALRETGGDAARYCKVGDADGFARSAIEIIRIAETGSGMTQQIRGICLAQAKKFSWTKYASEMARIYEMVMSTPR